MFDHLRYKLIRLLVILFIIILTNSFSFAQKKKPSRTFSVPADTSITIQEKPIQQQPENPELPTIELKDHTIVGERIITNVPGSEKVTNKSNVPVITPNPTGEGKGNRLVSGAGGIKIDQQIFYPTTNINNEFYSSYGNYNDVNVGLKLRKQFIDDELFADLDYRWNDGHLNYAKYNYFRNTITNIHRFNRYIQNKTQFSLTDNTYQFYGATLNPDEKRSRVNIDVSSTTGITGWDIANIRWDAGVRYMDPDKSQLFNWGLWTDLNVSNTVGSSFLTGTVKLNSDRIEIPLNTNQLDSLHAWIDKNTSEVPFTFLEKVRDDITNNSLLSNAFFGNARSTIEHVFARNLKVKGGLNVFHYQNTNKHNILYQFANKVQDDEITTIYPILGIEFNVGPMGSIFGQFEPKLSNTSLIQIINANPYINMSAPLSYQDVNSDIKIGWRRSGTYDLSFETYYNFKNINNYGVFVPSFINSLSSSYPNYGRWDYSDGHEIQIHELRALLNWRMNEYISIFSSSGIKNYNINNSAVGEELPYHPKMDSDFIIRAFPGFGIDVMLTGQFVSRRFTAEDIADNKESYLDPYFVSNFAISKKIGSHFEIYGQLNNILDAEYEIWKGYIAPGINGYAGFKVFW